MLLEASKSHPPLGAVLLAKTVGAQLQLETKWASHTRMNVGDDISLNNSASIIRYLARSAPQLNLYGNDILSRTKVDHWLSFTIGPLSQVKEFNSAMEELEGSVEAKQYLVNESLSAADFALFGALLANPFWQGLLGSNTAPLKIKAWFEFIGSHPEIKPHVDAIPKNIIPKGMAVPKKDRRGSSSRRRSSHKDYSKGNANQAAGAKATPNGGKPAKVQSKDDAKFVDLPDAKMGEVVVRFPPEASGYLHIGHAKAVLLNQHYQQHFKGKLILRFDDTNPAKEKEEYETVILHDLKLLQVKYDHFSRTSDHFETMLNYCEKLIKDGKAFVDNTDGETMKAEREQRQDSKNRQNSVESNLRMWEEMKKGSEQGQKCAVRAKMNMKSDNGCMRDPTIYRCKPETHPATGNRFKVYPTYDFACPIVDSIEGVTHALRTTEYMDRDEQFFWFIEALGLRKPHVYAYSRLSMTNTVMSKRKLTWFVENGFVDGWNDPRFPTVRGVLRRGLTIDALKQFIVAQGSSRSVVFMEWDKIWAMNKKVIDPVSPRYTTVDKAYNVLVNVVGVKEEATEADVHPKDPSVGKKTVWKSSTVLIDGADAEELKEDTNATFVNWGNLKVTQITKEDGKVTSVTAQPNLEDKDFKKTLKVTWLAQTEKAPFVPTIQVYYDHIISKPVLDKDDDFKNHIGKDTKFELEVLGDPELRKLKQGDIIQVQRRGFFIVDHPYRPPSANSCKPVPIRLIAIPDGTVSSYGPPQSGAMPKAAAPTAGKPKKANEGKPAPPKKASEGKPATPSVSVASSGGDASAIHDKIVAQGETVRALKSKKAAKPEIDGAVKRLLELKGEYKAAAGSDWKPGILAPKTSAQPPASEPASSSANPLGDELNGQVSQQGDQVRKLKEAKAAKPEIDAAVKTLLGLKAEYKKATGKDWKPGAHIPSVGVSTSGPAPVAGDAKGEELNGKIAEQGDLVRKLKGDKADKASIDAAVKALLSLKEEFKTATGQAWKPGSAGPAPRAKKESSPKTTTFEMSDLEKDLSDRISKQGELVRKLKVDKADKADVEANVKILLDLKEKFKEKMGKGWSPAGGGGGSAGGKRDKKQAKKPPKAPAPEVKKDDAAAKGQKVTRLGMEAKKSESLSDWYSQIIVKSELLEYYDISGCYILRPWAFSIWEKIVSFFDGEIKKLGVENCYFPMFVSMSSLQKEKDHIDDFSPEVAWVTRSGDSELAEPIAIRPTSETIMYPTFAKWIQSHRDLPLKINQWSNVVRWEFKQPQPFLRTREFLWQEGHTAYATQEEAAKEVLVILDLYRQIYEDLLAIPVIPGRKTEKEKFAGGDYTTTVEAFIAAAGRSIQGATSHHLGQNFSKMFDVAFESPESGDKQFVFQNSWGLTTRTLGVLILVHGDDQGLVLPPKVASIQVVIVPCGISGSDEDRKTLYDGCNEYAAALESAGVRVRSDLRENVSPGWKFNHWELKGVPIRLELGPKDMKKSQYVAVRRDTNKKLPLDKANVVPDITRLLDEIQVDMFQRAKDDLVKHHCSVDTWPEFLDALDQKKTIEAPFCGEKPCEERIKDESKNNVEVEEGAPSMGAKSLCIPFAPLKVLKPGSACVMPGCDQGAKFYTLFGRSY